MFCMMVHRHCARSNESATRGGNRPAVAHHNQLRGTAIFQTVETLHLFVCARSLLRPVATVGSTGEISTLPFTPSFSFVLPFLPLLVLVGIGFSRRFFVQLGVKTRESGQAETRLCMFCTSFSSVFPTFGLTGKLPSVLQNAAW